MASYLFFLLKHAEVILGVSSLERTMSRMREENEELLERLGRVQVSRISPIYFGYK